MQKMNYNQWKEAFVGKVRDHIRSVPELEDRGTVEVQIMSYINGEKRESLVMPELNSSGFSPAIRLRNLYEGCYLKGAREDELVASVAAVFIEHRDTLINKETLHDYQKMKNHLRIRVSGVEGNEDWINEKICEVEGDFIHSCYLDFLCGEERHITMNVAKQYAEVWNVSEAQVMEDARKGSMQFQVEMTTMQNILNDYLRDEGAMFIFENFELMPFEIMYVLREKDSPFGASVIARQDVLEAVGGILQDDYYVIPSSIHEVIVLPAQIGNLIGDLGTLVREINESKVASQKQLSDHIQFYDRRASLLMNADEYRRKMEREPEPEGAEGNQSPEELKAGLSL